MARTTPISEIKWMACKTTLLKIAKNRINRVEDVLTLGDVVTVVCLGKDKMGRISFSIKDCPKDGTIGRVVASADPE